MEGRGREGRGGEEVAEEGVVHLSRGEGVGEGRKAGRGSAYSHFFDRPDGARSGPCQEGLPVGRLCSLDGLKVTPLDSRAASWSEARREARATRETEWNSRRRTVRMGDHQGLDLWEGLLTGVWEVRREVSVERWRSNQVSRERRVGS